MTALVASLGFITSTLLTLVVVPAVLRFFSSNHRRTAIGQPPDGIAPGKVPELASHPPAPPSATDDSAEPGQS